MQKVEKNRPTSSRINYKKYLHKIVAKKRIDIYFYVRNIKYKLH